MFPSDLFPSGQQLLRNGFIFRQKKATSMLLLWLASQSQKHFYGAFTPVNRKHCGKTALKQRDFSLLPRFVWTCEVLVPLYWDHAVSPLFSNQAIREKALQTSAKDCCSRRTMSSHVLCVEPFSRAPKAAVFHSSCIMYCCLVCFIWVNCRHCHHTVAQCKVQPACTWCKG